MIVPLSSTLFCFGLGYSARALTAALRSEGWTVAGTTRANDKSAAITNAGITVHRFDRGHPLADPAAALADTTHLLISIPPDAAGDPVLGAHAADIIAAKNQWRWIGYLSTTGVYGDRNGAWVDESDAPNPKAERSKRRLAAERGWLALSDQSGLPVHIFRLAGIYGPGRSQLDGVRSGTAKRIVKPGHKFGRIHVEDIAGVLQASMRRPRPGGVYNVGDDEPAEPAAVTEFACTLLEVTPPSPAAYEEADMSAMARGFWADNRLVRNDRIKAELGYKLRYPTYREGLRAVLAAERAKTAR